MWYFCKYKDSLGKPNTGLHSYRIFNIAIIDVILTILFVKFIQYYIFEKQNFWILLIFTFILGIIIHRVFCVKTTIDKLLFN